MSATPSLQYTHGWPHATASDLARRLAFAQKSECVGRQVCGLTRLNSSSRWQPRGVSCQTALRRRQGSASNAKASLRVGKHQEQQGSGSAAQQGELPYSARQLNSSKSSKTKQRQVRQTQGAKTQQQAQREKARDRDEFRARESCGRDNDSRDGQVTLPAGNRWPDHQRNKQNQAQGKLAHMCLPPQQVAALLSSTQERGEASTDRRSRQRPPNTLALIAPGMTSRTRN